MSTTTSRLQVKALDGGWTWRIMLFAEDGTEVGELQRGHAAERSDAVSEGAALLAAFRRVQEEIDAPWEDVA